MSKNIFTDIEQSLESETSEQAKKELEMKEPQTPEKPNVEEGE